LDHGNLDLIRRSSRARYPLTLLVASVQYILVVFFYRKNRHYLGFHALFNICMYYTTVVCQGVEKLASQGNLSGSCDIIRSLLCIKWKTLGLGFNVLAFGS
jgi:hypothetical protein